MSEEKLIRTLFLGFIRVHILHHCARRPWFGQELVGELAEHGYELSFGTLYPLLHTLEKEGWLSREERLEGGRWRKYYRCTETGKEVLAQAKHQVKELSQELEEEEND